MLDVETERWYLNGEMCLFTLTISMKIRVFLFMLLGALLVGTTARAAEIVVPTARNENIIIGFAETHKNLYTAGGNITVNNATQGDLTAAGGLITLTGTVEQEAIIAGGTLNVSGSIGGTARIVGGNITVSGPIGGDLVIAGGNVNITGNAKVAGDLLAAGGNVIVDVPVNGIVRIAGGSITINSKITGDVYVMTSKELVFGPQADVSGVVHHTGTKQAVVQPGANVRNIQYTPVQHPRARVQLAGLLTAALFVKFLALLVAAFILAGCMKKSLPRLVEQTFKQPWNNLGIGLLSVVVTPAAIIILFATVVGFLMAFMLGAAFALALMLVSVFAAIALGYLILRWCAVPIERAKPWQAILIGSVVWSVLKLIPVFGWIPDCMVFLMVFGALVRMIPKWRKEMGNG